MFHIHKYFAQILLRFQVQIHHPTPLPIYTPVTNTSYTLFVYPPGPYISMFRIVISREEK
jgi:hypothetical protein